MGSFALRGYRSSRRTFFRGFVPRHAHGLRGGMGGLLKVALLGTCTYFIAKKLSHANQSPPHVGSNGGSQPVQTVSQ
ncbi:uncharacterized protein N7479_003576 [Penicillium vulpinum]|uniref:Uncharacterized protein n=1 Tax=Penicillium vulpinum TaxID=29845 RepID=A0A1V6RW40_9EURO|nr:uncharacterized protein N7479_003576 [Penicillium vulpinum]KAJ5963700.1 hypothetical protein N7479_003576 [Penicillium vulpinum]OQE05997.1 hypothetical protein PENVUL_c020G06780 [Penicillium vulpinum]